MNQDEFDRQYERFVCGGEVSQDFLNYLCGNPELFEAADKDAENYWGFVALVRWIVNDA